MKERTGSFFRCLSAASFVSLVKKIGKPLFHHLHVFGVSQFMTEEWARFWHERNTERLMYALIINEQNTIQTPIIQNPSFKKNVFDTIPFI